MSIHSRWFTTGKPSEKFFTHLKELAELPADLFKHACHIWPIPPREMTKESREKLVALAKDHDISLEALANSISVATAIFNEIEQNEDDLESILIDSFEKAKLNTEQQDGVRTNLNSFTGSIKNSLTSELDVTNTFHGTFPYLDHMHTRISSFTVFENEYNVVDDSPDTYKPKEKTTERVAVIQIDINSFGETTYSSFALRAHELDKMINRLKLARCQLQSMSGE